MRIAGRLRTQNPQLANLAEGVLGYGLFPGSEVCQRHTYLLTFLWTAEMLKQGKPIVQAMCRRHPVIERWLTVRCEQLEPPDDPRDSNIVADVWSRGYLHVAQQLASQFGMAFERRPSGPRLRKLMGELVAMHSTSAGMHNPAMAPSPFSHTTELVDSMIHFLVETLGVPPWVTCVYTMLDVADDGAVAFSLGVRRTPNPQLSFTEVYFIGHVRLTLALQLRSLNQAGREAVAAANPSVAYVGRLEHYFTAHRRVRPSLLHESQPRQHDTSLGVHNAAMAPSPFSHLVVVLGCSSSSFLCQEVIEFMLLAQVDPTPSRALLHPLLHPSTPDSPRLLHPHTL